MLEGCLVLPGAQPALGGTPGMMGYGMAKAAIHQLTKSLASADSGLPSDAKTFALLPITLGMYKKMSQQKGSNIWIYIYIFYQCENHYSHNRYSNEPEIHARCRSFEMDTASVYFRSSFQVV